MYYSAIGLLAIMILLIENHDILLDFKGDLEKPAWKVYRRFLFAVLAYYITDVLWGLLESKKLAPLLFADTTVYFIAMAVGVLFWAQFTVAYLEEQTEFGKWLVLVGRVVAGTITFLAAVNIFAPVLFTVDAEGVYRAFPVRYVILAAQILLLLMISVYAFTRLRLHPTMREKRYRALIYFGLIMALFLFIQIWFPYIPLYSVAYMLGTCLLHTYVVNDEREENRRGLDEAAEVKVLRDTIVSLLDNMPAMTYTKDAQTGVYNACNQAFADYAKKESPAGVIGLKADQLFDAGTAKQFDEEDKIALSMDQPYIFLEEVSDGGGNQRQLQTTKLKYTNFAGKTCILGMSQDVTDLVRVQRENAKTKEAYEAARNTGIIYTHIAQALARGYMSLYYVNLDTEEFSLYRNDEDSGMLVEAHRGWHFFEECRLAAEHLIHPDDRDAFVKAMDRKTLVAALDRNGSFVMTYRKIKDDKPMYVTMRVSRMVDDERCIVLGITDVDEQMRQRRAALRVIEEQIAYARINALTGDYLCVYIVDPESGRYREVSSNQGYETLAQAKEGKDFFNTTRDAARDVNHPDDVNRFLQAFTRENILAEIERHGIFTLSYRIMMEGKPLYVQLKAAMVQEKEGARLIVGINNIDAQVRQEETYVKNIAQARISANIDALTGVKNRHAYLEAEDRLNIQIDEQRAPEFAVVLLDVNDLKKVNDTEGHKAGDQYLRDACKIICDTFKHSPVFRIGGDEFAVISQGNDYACIDELVGRMNAQNTQARQNGGIVIACGMAKYSDDDRVAQVFERADQMMYENKNNLKAERDG